MKKNTSITLDEKLIETLDAMRQPEHHDRKSFSDMVSHLIKSNPKYIAFTKKNQKNNVKNGN